VTMSLYHSRGSCSLASLIVLEASGLPYDVVEVNTGQRENFTPSYLAINAAGKVPALRLTNGDILTENPAILTHIGDCVPDRQLIPAAGTLARARAHEWLNYLSSGVHIAYRSVFRPERLSTNPEAADGIRARGRIMVREALSIVEARLAARETMYSISESLSVCDAYLLIYWLWSHREIIGADLPALPNYDALVSRIVEERTVRTILAREEVFMPGTRDGQQ
jgi:glutathione S-transferase